MILIPFPIAYSRQSVNLLSYVILPTYLLPQDDTPDVIPRHTMLRHAYHLSAARNFRLNPKEVSGLSSLALPLNLCIPSSMCSASRAGETSACATQEHTSEAAKRVSTPHLIPPIPTRQFHVKHMRIIPARSWEGESSTCARAGSLRSPSSSLRSSCAAGAHDSPVLARPRPPRPAPARPGPIPTHLFHVKHAREDLSPPGACRDHEVSRAFVLIQSPA